MKILGAALLAGVCAACAAPFSQNIGLVYGIKRGTSAEDVHELMGTPAEALSIDGVDEWRYCTTNRADEIAVVYFLGGLVVDRAFFTISDERSPHDMDSCRGNLHRTYVEGRKPPRRVRELRAQHKASGPR